MSNKNEALVITRNEFYYKSYRAVAQVLLLVITITLLLIGFFVYQSVEIAPLPEYFPTTPDGRLIYMPPIDINHLELSKQKVNPATGIIVGMPSPTRTYVQLEPDGEDALVKYWVFLAISNMFDYDYVHYRTVIQSASQYFTPLGHQRFIDALISSKNLETVKARSAVVIPEITGPVNILGHDMVLGHYSWNIEVPVKLTYASAASDAPLIQSLLAKISVARVSTLSSPFYGLAIYQLNFEQVFDNGQ